jgi:eukaryotic translation initiation factor 2C
VEHAYNANQVGTMFVGGDVTHPSPDQKDIPSVVGVAASYDVTGFKYNCSWRLQGPRVEMIKDFENIMVDHLNFYRHKNGQFPNRIFYYRDGVSEGQFQEVLDDELCGLKKACVRLKCNPKITFVIVQKRHHTRFFPDKKFGDGKNNISAGTIVDKDIVHPHQYQFFLASHAAIQGVTKPTKYCVIYDENQMHPDYMEHLTYSLCHLFTRCNRAVSYAAPTYYAHLVAARGKQYIIGGRRVDVKNLDREYNQRKISNEIINNFPMFFV